MGVTTCMRFRGPLRWGHSNGRGMPKVPFWHIRSGRRWLMYATPVQPPRTPGLVSDHRSDWYETPRTTAGETHPDPVLDEVLERIATIGAPRRRRA